MKLLLLHGPAISESRQKLLQIKKQFEDQNVIVFEQGVSIQETIGAISTLPLIEDKRLYILENPPEDFSFGSYQSDSLTLIFWLDHQLDEKKGLLKFVKDNKGQVIFFPEAKEVTVFPFIDALGYRDKKAFIELQKLKNGGFDTQYIITMIFYLLRSLAVDNKKSPPFVQKNIARQRQNFNDIAALYKFVLETDYKIKSGLLESDQAEFILVNRFLEP